MSIKVLINEILLDTQNSTAQFVFDNLNNGEFDSVSQVPRFRYTSLNTLCSSYGGISSILHGYQGVASDKPNKIELQQVEIDEDLMIAGTDEADDENMVVQILVKLTINQVASPSTALAQYELIRDIGLRLRYILDSRLRSVSTNQFMYLRDSDRRDPDVSVDNTLTPDQDYLIEWKRSGKATATEQVHLLVANFSRAFGVGF
jgi:hypothetical protein